MYAPPGAKTDSTTFPIPDQMKAWVLDDPEELRLSEKPVAVPHAPKCWFASMRSPSARPTLKSSVTAHRR